MCVQGDERWLEEGGGDWWAWRRMKCHALGVGQGNPPSGAGWVLHLVCLPPPLLPLHLLALGTTLAYLEQ